MVILSVVFVVYLLLMACLLTGWRRAAPSAQQTSGKDPLISVVVAVRNEENNIPKLLASLAAQDYGHFEIIIVNDDSEDETLWAISQSGLKNLRVVHSPGKGKKAALAAGIRVAKGSIIATTDADCIVPSGWLRQIREPFRDRQTMLVFGGVRMEGDGSFFSTLQAMEFASLIGSGASTASLGFPTMCNGANLAFRKMAFAEVNGYHGNMEIPSGDDEFLMRKIRARYPNSIRFIWSNDAIVTTQVAQSVTSFLHQRIRWASKWKHNSSLYTSALAVVVLLFQVAFVVNWGYLFTSSILTAGFLMTLKMIPEAAFMLQVCRFLNIRWKWTAYFVLQIAYPLYVIGIGIGSFVRPFEWKHRVFAPR